MTTLNVSIDLLDDKAIAKAGAVFDALRGTTPAASPAAEQPAKPGRKKSVEAPQVHAAPDAAAAPTPAALASTPPPEVAPEVSRDEVANAVLALSKTKGRAAAVGVLETFRAAVKDEYKDAPEIKLPMVPKEQYGNLLAAIKAA